MEKDHNQQRENHHDYSDSIFELKNELYRQKTNFSYFNKELKELSNKFSALDQMISSNEKEKNEEISTIQRHLLRQEVEIEHILEKIKDIANEIEEITIKVAGFKKEIKQHNNEDVQTELTDVKKMLSDLIQLMGNSEKEKVTDSVESSRVNKRISAKKYNKKLPSDKNNFLKLNQYMSEDQQSIVVSPVKKKKQKDSHFQPNYQFPQYYDKPKSIKIDSSPRTNGKQQQKHVQSSDDDDQFPSAMMKSTFLNNTDIYQGLQTDLIYSIQQPNTKILDPQKGISFQHFLTKSKNDETSNTGSINHIKKEEYTEKTKQLDENEYENKRNVSGILLQSKSDEENRNIEYEEKRSWISLLNIFK